MSGKLKRISVEKYADQVSNAKRELRERLIDIERMPFEEDAELAYLRAMEEFSWKVAPEIKVEGITGIGERMINARIDCEVLAEVRGKQPRRVGPETSHMKTQIVASVRFLKLRGYSKTSAREHLRAVLRKTQYAASVSQIKNMEFDWLPKQETESKLGDLAGFSKSQQVERLCKWFDEECGLRDPKPFVANQIRREINCMTPKPSRKSE